MTARANRDRAKEYLARFLTIVRTFDVNALVKLLDEAEGRGAQRAALGEPDRLTVDALLDTVQDSLGMLSKHGVPQSVLDDRARNLVQGVIGNFHVRLMDDEDVTQPANPGGAP